MSYQDSSFWRFPFLLLVILSSGFLEAQQITMAGRRSYLLSGTPQAVITADFNRDGRLDIAATDGPYLAEAVSILLQAADGSFQQPISYAVGTSPTYIAKGEFNHDGFVDLVVIDSSNLRVLLGNGDGTLQAAVPFPLPPPPSTATGLAVADLNRDGNMDIAVLSSFPGTSISVLFGTGDGSFQADVTRVIDSETSGWSLQFADFNRDGKADAVFFAVDAYSHAFISVSLGNGDGTFPAATHYSVGSRPVGLTVADFNSDGALDLVQADSYHNYGSILLGNGDGTFQPQSIFYGVGYPTFLRAGDFNGDGKPDLASLDSYDQQLLVLAGQGDATFQSLSSTPTGPQWGMVEVAPMAVADLNSDLRADILIASSYAETGSVMVLTGRGDGTFVSEAFLSSWVDRLAAGYVNLDRKVDLVTVSQDQILTFLGNGNGSFQSPLVSPLAFRPGSLLVSRINANVTLDLAVTDNTAGILYALFGDGQGFFGQPVGTQILDSEFVSFRADFNTDRRLDLVVGNYEFSHILFGRGDGVFPVTVPLHTAGNVQAVTDFNGDGIQDILLHTPQGPGTLAVLLGNGNGSFQAPITTYLTYLLQAVAVADFNLDGKTDLAIAYQVGGSDIAEVRLGNGDGTFGAPQPFSLPRDTVSRMLAADLNRDGKPDLVAAMVGLSAVMLLPGDGQGGFAGPSIYGVQGVRPTDLVVADFTADGRPDIATNNTTGISILIQTSPPN